MDNNDAHVSESSSEPHSFFLLLAHRSGSLIPGDLERQCVLVSSLIEFQARREGIEIKGSLELRESSAWHLGGYRVEGAHGSCLPQGGAVKISQKWSESTYVVLEHHDHRH